MLGFKHNLEESRGDNKRMTTTLEGMMSSHTQLQLTIEALQVELGKKVHSYL